MIGRAVLFTAAMLPLLACSGKATPTADGKRPVTKTEEKAAADPNADSARTKVTLGELIIEGPRSGDQLIAVATENIESLRECYEERLAKDPTLGGGEVAIRLNVSASGSIDDALINNSKLKDHRVGTCMLRAAKTWKLPPDDSGVDTKATVPIFFEPPA